MGTILLVEDDYVTAEWLQELIKRELADWRPQVEVISTESDFALNWLPEFEAGLRQRPDAIILDVMLRWTDPGPNSPAPPPEVIQGGFDAAGLRCCSLIQSKTALAHCPVILLTHFSENDLEERGGKPPRVLFVPKDDEKGLLGKIRSILAARWNPPHTDSARRDRVFISYSHKDRKFLDELLVHLKPLERANRISAWSDRQIEVGSKWFDEIARAVAATRVAIMLVSAEFLASDFIHEHELGPFLKKAENDGARILWIPIRACSYKYSALKNYQAVISPDKPLAEMKTERNQAWVRVCEEIKKAAMLSE